MRRRSTSQVEVAWLGGMRFKSNDSNGHTVTVDAPAVEGEPYEGMMPGHLLLTSLAACSGIDVVNILKRQRQDVTGLSIEVDGSQLPDPPWTWTHIRLVYRVRGAGLKRSAVERAIHLSETKYCSIGATLAGRAEISSTFEIVEVDSRLRENDEEEVDE